VAKEVLFIAQILETMGVEIDYPIDNDSDILTNNVSGILHEKHVPKMMRDENDETTK
jgi:hypothetical protein